MDDRGGSWRNRWWIGFHPSRAGGDHRVVLVVFGIGPTRVGSRSRRGGK